MTFSARTGLTGELLKTTMLLRTHIRWDEKGMPETVGVHELRSQASRVIRAVSEEMVEYVITLRGEPVAMLRPLTKEERDRLREERVDLTFDGAWMGTGRTALTKEEREILLLGIQHLDEKFLATNSEIAQLCGIPVSKVKAIVHQLYAKLGARTRLEALLIALRQGEINVDVFFPFDGLAEVFGSFGPAGLRQIAHLVRQELEHGYIPEIDEQAIPWERRRDGILTSRQRDVLILVGRGLTTEEIADSLCISISTVRAHLHRASKALGANSRTDAFTLALRRGEIAIVELYSLNEVVQRLAPLGAEAIEKMAQLLEQKH
jgi:prevent-host-death family protein